MGAISDFFSGMANDFAMGTGLKEKDQSYVDRTAANIARTQGNDAASNYADVH